MAERQQVIIVGGGPVGVALAVELAQREVKTLVVERHREVGTIPKGQNLMNRSLEHFWSWGCVDELRAARVLPPGYPIGGITAYKSLTGEYSYMPQGPGAAGTFFYQRNERLPQYLTEQVLRTRLSALPSASCRFGVAATGIEQDADGARVRVENEEWPYEEEVLEADYVVGCDGARSLVREQLGIPRRGRNFDQKMVLAVFASDDLHQGLERYPERTTYRVMHPDYHGVWLFFGRVGIGEWFFHGPVPRETEAGDLETIRSLMHLAAGWPFECEFQHVGFWELRIEVATEYRKGRIFIAGDACHSHPPYGGLGLNNGLEDVRNLGWKLAAAIGGWGGETLLDSYGKERQPVFEQTGEDVIAAGIDAEGAFLARYRPEDDLAGFEAHWSSRGSGEVPQGGYEPHYDASPVIVGGESGDVGVHGEYRPEARPGHHLMPVALSSGENVYEALGPDLTLLAFDGSEAAARRFAEAATELKVPLRTVTDSFADERLGYGARLVLVRPDHFVAWSGDDVDDATDVLRRATGAD